MTVETKRLKYTIGFIYCPETNQCLLLNREKSPWKGRWNGVGGKLDVEEAPLECIIRETKEETGLFLPQYKSRGAFLWDTDKQGSLGMYVFTAQVTKEDIEKYPTPKKFCNEGILDWKYIDWIMDKENTGVVNNIQEMFNYLFEATEKDTYFVQYRNEVMTKFLYNKNGNSEYPIH